MEPGKLITLEGIEGVGKTTQVSRLLVFLKERGYPVISTREPGGTPLSEAIRQLILNPPIAENWASDTELLLLAAARAQHLHALIRPQLEAGVWVVCDRFVDATFAYQGGGRGVSMARIEALMAWVLGDFQSNWTFWLDLPVAEAMHRIYLRQQIHDRFEAEPHAFFERVRLVYEARAAQFPDRIIRIDAGLNPDQVFEQMKIALLHRIDA